jgi:hypothetical protein
MGHASRFVEVLAEVEGWESPKIALRKELALLEVQQLQDKVSPLYAAVILAMTDPGKAKENLASLEEMITDQKLQPEKILLTEEQWVDVLDWSNSED